MLKFPRNEGFKIHLFWYKKHENLRVNFLNFGSKNKKLRGLNLPIFGGLKGLK